MGSYMHLLLEALRAHLSNNGKSLARSSTENDVGHFTGFSLEDLRVNTHLPLNMDGEINPLIELLYGEDKSQFQINRLQDHLARIEMKVQQLESRVPCSVEQRLLVGAAEVDSDTDADDEEEEEQTSKKKSSQPSNKGNQSKGENGQKGKDQKGKDQKGKGQKGKCEGGDEDDKKNCFARLFFSKCWSGSQGRNNKAGWNLKSCCSKPGRVKKGACPAYSTCPCGDDAPCAKIEKKPCPANQKKSDGGKGKSSSGDGKGKSNEGDGKGESSKGNKEKCEKKKKDENPLSALCGKLCNSPCIFSRKNGEDGEGKSGWRCGSCNRKKHVHTPCCCRCKDNPPLPEEKKKPKQNQPAKTDKNKQGPPKQESKPPQKQAKRSTSADYGTADEGDDAVSVQSAIILPMNDGKDPTQEPMRCVGCTDCDDIRRGNRQPKNHKGATQVFKSEEKVNLNEDMVEKDVKKRSKGEIEVVPKSSTNFQVLLPPSISSESTDHNMVSHQILKTLSTIHGPIRVEQKIVVKGTKNAFVIVTHGEACECHICSTLKNDSIADKTSDGSPKVVRFPTDNGCDTLVNHSDNCQCTLCSVLEQGITEEAPTMEMDECSSRTVWASWSENNERTLNNQSSESVTQDTYPNRDTKKNCEVKGCSTCERKNGRDVFKKHCHKNKEEKYRKKKCHCLKCVKRRKVKRLKKRLKNVLQPSDLSQVLRELSHHGFTVEQDPQDAVSQNGDDEDEENMRKASSKRVSFSGDTKTLTSTDSKETVLTGDSQYAYGRKELVQITKTDDNEHKRKTKGTKGVMPKYIQKGEVKMYGHIKAASPHSIDPKFIDKPCDCLICNSRYSDTTSRVTTKSKIVHFRPSKEEEQKCFPEKSKVPSKCGCMKDTSTSESEQLHEKMLAKVTHPDDDFIRPPTRCEPGCTGRCRFLAPRDEISRLGSDHITPVVLQTSSERLPPNVLYWIPSSPNLAAAFSSDSYYIPDLDEFPTSDRECKSTEQPTPYPSNRNHCQTNPQPPPGSSCGTGKTRILKDMHFH